MRAFSKVYFLSFFKSPQFCWGLLCIFFSCNTILNRDDCNDAHPHLKTEYLESIDLPLNGAQYNHITPALLNIDTTTLFIGLDADNYFIDVFDLNQRRLLRKITLNKKGPNAIENITGMFVHSLDSIFLISIDINQIYLVDLNGEVINKWKFDQTLPDEFLDTHKELTGDYIIWGYGRSELINLPFYFDPVNTEILASINYETWLNGSSEYFYYYERQLPCIVKFNLKTNEMILLGNFPKEFARKRIPHNPFAVIAPVNDRIFYQFNSSDKLYRDDGISVCGRSKFAKNQVTLFAFDGLPNPEDEFSAYNTDEAYINLYYDRWNKLLYRVFKLGQDKFNVEGKLNQKLQASWSLIVMDLDGKIYGEYLFEKSKYDFFNIHVTPLGLLISKENPFNPNNLEELYSFDLIRFDLHSIE